MTLLLVFAVITLAVGLLIWFSRRAGRNEVQLDQAKKVIHAHEVRQDVEGDNAALSDDELRAKLRGKR